MMYIAQMAAPGWHSGDGSGGRAPANWAAFVAVLSLAIVIDNAPHARFAWDAWVSQGTLSNPGETVARGIWVLIALWTLISVRSLFRYAVLCAVGSLVIVSMLPAVPNHWILELGAFVGSLVVLATTRDPQQRLAGLRTLILASILVVYFWAFLHKLNWGFVDPTASCAAVFLDSLADRLGLPAPSSALRAAAVYSVLLAEAAMPFLLLSSRSRGVAILLGFGLHLMFGLFIAGFSLFMWACYFILLPPGSLEPASAQTTQACARVLRPIPPRLRRVRLPGWMLQAAAFAILLAAVLAMKDVPRLARLPQQETLLIPAAILVGSTLLSGLCACRMRLPIALPPRKVLAAAVIFPSLLLLNGAVPYTQCETRLPFSMFSNLRVEDDDRTTGSCRALRVASRSCTTPSLCSRRQTRCCSPIHALNIGSYGTGRR